MNWTHFLAWLAGGYGLYYAIMILADLIRGKRQDMPAGTAHELTFSEQVTPVQLSSQPINETKAQKPAGSRQEPELTASGGVPITDLFRLAKQEAIIYTRSVSF